MYSFEGCFVQQKAESIEPLLGPHYVEITSADPSLALCLDTCVSTVEDIISASRTETTHDKPPERILKALLDRFTSPTNRLYHAVFVRGDAETPQSCYCSTTLKVSALTASHAVCGAPCPTNSADPCYDKNVLVLAYALSTISSAAHDTTSHISSSSQSVPIAITTTSGSGSGIGNTSLLIHDGSTSITIGIVIGIGLVVSLILAVAKRWIRSCQAASTTQETAALDIDVMYDRAVEEVNNGMEVLSVGTARKLNLVKFEGVVSDASTPRASPVTPRITDKISAATGAEWRSGGGSPLTPRTSRTQKILGSRNEQGSTTTQSVNVHHPAGIAQNHGLGERAWHRRRLSTLFPPDGGGQKIV